MNRVTRSLTLAAAAAVLTAAAGVSTAAVASAATISSTATIVVANPQPTCDPWSQIYYLGPPVCTCPQPGWYVWYPDFWQFTVLQEQPQCRLDGS